MPFSEICIYQVKPQKVEEFEALMLEVKALLEKQSGLLLLRFVKREYHIDMEQIREGLPPPKITRIVKSVKYMLYWEFDTKESYGAAQKNLYDSYWKSIEKCLVVPHDKLASGVVTILHCWWKPTVYERIGAFAVTLVGLTMIITGGGSWQLSLPSSAQNANMKAP